MRRASSQQLCQLRIRFRASAWQGLSCCGCCAVVTCLDRTRGGIANKPGSSQLHSKLLDSQYELTVSLSPCVTSILCAGRVSSSSRRRIPPCSKHQPVGCRQSAWCTAFCTLQSRKLNASPPFAVQEGHRAHRVGELHQCTSHGGAGQLHDQQVQRGAAGCALLRRQREHRPHGEPVQGARSAGVPPGPLRLGRQCAALLRQVCVTPCDCSLVASSMPPGNRAVRSFDTPRASSTLDMQCPGRQQLESSSASSWKVHAAQCTAYESPDHAMC